MAAPEYMKDLRKN